MRDIRDGCGDGGDAGQKQKICGMTDMAKWVRRMAADWEILDRDRLPT